MSTRSVFADAGRGAVTGFATVAGGYLAYRLAEAYARADSNNYTNSADAVGDFALMFLVCGLPLCFLAGYVSARWSRLPWPWLVSLVGLAASTVLICGASGEDIAWRILAMIATYVGVAMAVGAIASTREIDNG